jgi:L-lactate dehydrogenase complex protein LldG
MLKVGLRGYARLATLPRWFAVSQKFAAVGSRVVSPFSEWIRMPAFTGWGFSKDFPRPAGKSFRERWENGKLGNRELGIGDDQSTKLPISEPSNIQTFKPANLSERFTAELTALGGTVIPCAVDELPQAITRFLRDREASQVFVDAMGGESLPAGFAAVREANPSIKVGLTGCSAGIANTGTVLLLDAGETLKASLLPETHLVILRASQLVVDLPEALAKTRDAANAVLVTGPSRTADIEMTLTIGVHGPKEIVVFLVDDSIIG